MNAADVLSNGFLWERNVVSLFMKILVSRTTVVIHRTTLYVHRMVRVPCIHSTRLFIHWTVEWYYSFIHWKNGLVKNIFQTLKKQLKFTHLFFQINFWVFTMHLPLAPSGIFFLISCVRVSMFFLTRRRDIGNLHLFAVEILSTVFQIAGNFGSTSNTEYMYTKLTFYIWTTKQVQ